MSTPQKPWEQPSLNRMQTNSSGNSLATPVGRYRVAPVVPPRPNTSGYGNSSYSGYGMNSYGGYNRGIGYSPYSSYGGYGGYGGYQSGYGGYGGMSGMGGMYGGYGGMTGYGYGAENRFIELAEQSTRPAFQSIESLIRAFSSVSMMLDSTFFAMTSSFRAILGVADNFGQLRSMFGQVWSSFAVFRFISWLYRKILSTLGLKTYSDLGQEVWNQAVNEGVSAAGPKQSGWPIFVFLGLIISAPYLITKLIPPALDKKDPKNWPSKGHPVKVNYEFGATNPQELSIRPGEIITIAPKSVQDDMALSRTGWVYALSQQGAGIVPMNYLQPANIPGAPAAQMKPEMVSDSKFDDAFTGAGQPGTSSQPNGDAI